MPSDTFKYVPAGLAAAPGTCRICGSNQRDFIDFGLWLEYEGAILFCTECVKNLVQVDELGLMFKSEVVTLMVDNERLIARDKEMKEVRKDLRNALVAIADNIDFRISKHSPKSVSSTPIPVPVAEGYTHIIRREQ